MSRLSNKRGACCALLAALPLSGSAFAGEDYHAMAQALEPLLIRAGLGALLLLAPLLYIGISVGISVGIKRRAGRLRWLAILLAVDLLSLLAACAMLMLAPARLDAPAPWIMLALPGLLVAIVYARKKSGPA